MVLHQNTTILLLRASVLLEAWVLSCCLKKQTENPVHKWEEKVYDRELHEVKSDKNNTYIYSVKKVPHFVREI